MYLLLFASKMSIKSSIVASHRMAMSADAIRYSPITARISCTSSALPLDNYSEKTYIVVYMTKRDRARDIYSTLVFLSKHNIRWLFVHPDSKSFELRFNDLF